MDWEKDRRRHMPVERDGAPSVVRPRSYRLLKARTVDEMLAQVKREREKYLERHGQT